jgi:hypothetical protein
MWICYEKRCWYDSSRFLERLWGCLMFEGVFLQEPLDSVEYQNHMSKLIINIHYHPLPCNGKSPRYFWTIFPRKKRPLIRDFPSPPEGHNDTLVGSQMGSHWGPPASGLQKTLGSMDLWKDSVLPWEMLGKSNPIHDQKSPNSWNPKSWRDPPNLYW